MNQLAFPYSWRSTSRLLHSFLLLCIHLELQLTNLCKHMHWPSLWKNFLAR